MTTYEIRLLGTFEVWADGQRVSDDRWRRRHAALLVKRLALAPGRRLHREQMLDALWPDLTIDEASPRLHKAAHYARRAIGPDGAVVLRGDAISLLPDDDVRIDSFEFETRARRAISSGDPSEVTAAIDSYGGELLPGDLYEPFTEELRDHLRLLHLDLLRLGERWDDVLAIEPADEAAHLALMRRHAEHGDRHAALRQYERMARVLGRELGVQPGREATQLRDALLREEHRRVPDPARAELVGRTVEQNMLVDLLQQVRDGRGTTVLVGGAPGIGKSALLRWARGCALDKSFRVGQGAAASVEGVWPYAPILEALADLCRRHPTLLDGLDDQYREEIDRALGGSDLRWNGESSRQRLFVAAVELVRLAAAGAGVLLVLDDLHDADDATLRLLHYLARSTRHDRVAIMVSFRSATSNETFEHVRANLLAREAAVELTLRPLDRTVVRQLLDREAAELSADARDEITSLAGGVPFLALNLAAQLADPLAGPAAAPQVTVAVRQATRDVLQRVAVIGATFDTDEFVTLSGLSDDEAYGHLDVALSAKVIEHVEGGYRFRHAMLRDALLAELPPHRHRAVHRDAARRLAELDAAPARVGHHLLLAGDPVAAAPYLLRAAETAASVGAYRDALALIDSVMARAPRPAHARLLALRADVLLALGDIGAANAYRDALDHAPEENQRLLRARLGRASLLSGDLATAAAVLDPLALDADDEDAELLLARGNLAFFRGEIDEAWAIANQAKRQVLRGDKSWQMLDLVALQGQLAHDRGEWFDTLRVELRRAVDRPDIALVMFDGYLCPAEYLLYGSTPYAEVLELAEGLRETARRAGAMRAMAFATALIGEAALLSGDLVRAERELTEAIDLHRDIEARAGEAHCLQRLAEVRLAQGDAAEARRLLERALQPARWSNVALHLLQRILGTFVRAAPDAAAARIEVDRAEDFLGREDFCPFCDVMFAVPAAIACADVGDTEQARHYLARAKAWEARWEGTAWRAAILEAQAHLARAEHYDAIATDLLTQAGALFESAGQPIDAARCRRETGALTA